MSAKIGKAKCADTGTAEERKQTHRRSESAKLVMSYLRDLILYLVLFILTAYASLNTKPLKVARAPSPTQFIQNTTFVEDFNTGKLTATQNKVATEEISFVLYYAPWCAESRNIRQTYENVAKIFHGRVHFSAINCWEPRGECRIQYSNVPSWPTLMAYRSNGIGIQYNGPWKEAALIKFISTIMHPLARVDTIDDLLRLTTSNTAVVLALIDVMNNQTNYRTYYQTALKHLEIDPTRQMAFAVCTGHSAKQFGVNSMPKLRMYLWNETLEYPNPNGSMWSTFELLRWIKRSAHVVSQWITPSGLKSNSLAATMSDGILLLFFTPRTFTSYPSEYASLMTQISFSFKNCYNDTWINELLHKYMDTFRQDEKEKFKNVYKTCQRQGYCSADNQVGCEPHGSVLSRLIAEENVDLRSPQKLLELRRADECTAFDVAESSYPLSTNIHSLTDLQDISEIAGYSCKLNKSSSVVLMDSLEYDIYAQRLGINLSQRPDRTSLVIVDPEVEKVYAMNDPINVKSIVAFLKNYTLDQLSPIQRTEEARPMPFAHLYKKSSSHRTNDRVTIEEIPSKLFESRLIGSKKSIVVLFYSSHCAFCTIMSHYLLSLSHLLADFPHIEFLRIDGDKNDLPEKFVSPDAFPSLVIYPVDRKNESRAFPVDQKVALQSLFNFIFSNLPRPIRMQGILMLCKKVKKNIMSQYCLDALRNEVTSNISLSLQRWRTHPTRRKQELDMIYSLKKIYLHLLSLKTSCDFKVIENDIKEIIQIQNYM